MDRLSRVQSFAPYLNLPFLNAFSQKVVYGWSQRGELEKKKEIIGQAITGIMHRFGPEGCPTYHGLASCVDYLCGDRAHRCQC